MEKQISALHILMIALLAAATAFVHGSIKITDSNNKFLSPPPEHLNLFTFGFADSLADSIWLRWIQDSDYCQTFANKKPVNPIQAQTGEFSNPRYKFCDNSWSFKMLDAVTTVAPRFRMPYFAGAIVLSVLVEDYEGAKVIFDRGVENYPNDWLILYRASYHYLFDRHDLAHAAELMKRAQENGAPGWLALSAARLYSKSGQLEMGIKTLEDYKQGLTDEKEIANVDRRLEDLKKQLNQ